MGNTRGESEGERKRGGSQRGRKEVGMDCIVEQGVREFIVFRGTVDLAVRIGKRNQRTMTEKHPCAGSIKFSRLKTGLMRMSSPQITRY